MYFFVNAQYNDNDPKGSRNLARFPDQVIISGTANCHKPWLMIELTHLSLSREKQGEVSFLLDFIGL